MNQTWQQAQDWELNWHTSYPFHYYEQIKQEVYAEKMGIVLDYPDFDLKDRRIVDIGSGPVSMLLKYKNLAQGSMVADPLMDRFPRWVRSRYISHNLFPITKKGEDISSQDGFDEVWMYNVLQHTDDPKMVVGRAKAMGKVIRIFEWIEEPISPGHLHTLHEEQLNKWFKGKGKVEKLSEKGCVGLSYYGIFNGK